MPKRILFTERNIALISILLIIIFGIPTFYPIIKDAWPKSEQFTEISVIGEINKPLNFDSLIDYNSLNLKTIYPDSLVSGSPDKTTYQFGDKITITLKLDLAENSNRYVSAFLIDNNNLVRMSFPSLNEQSLVNQILENNLTIKNIIENDTASLKNLDETLKIFFNTENSRNFISNGNWRIVVILWMQRNEEIMPTLLFSENVVLEAIKSEDGDISSILNIIFSVLTGISALLAIYMIIRLSKRIKITKKNEMQSEETHEPEQEPPHDNPPPPNTEH